MEWNCIYIQMKHSVLIYQLSPYYIIRSTFISKSTFIWKLIQYHQELDNLASHCKVLYFYLWYQFIVMQNPSQIAPVGGFNRNTHLTSIEAGIILYNGNPSITSIGNPLTKIWWTHDQLTFSLHLERCFFILKDLCCVSHVMECPVLPFIK